MFSGIVEELTEVVEMQTEGSNVIFSFRNPFGKDIYIDQSISHNGVCLTVVSFDEDQYKVVAINETLKKTNLGHLSNGDLVNLERCVKADTRMDGHVVQGHIDCTGIIKDIRGLEGSWEYDIEIYKEDMLLVIPQGSITLNGISLTIAQLKEELVTVAIIPYTYEHTNLQQRKIGDGINIEFDVFGKYVVNYMKRTQA